MKTVETGIATSPDAEVMQWVVESVHRTGKRLLEVFSEDARPSSRADMAEAARVIQDIAVDGLRDSLAALRPGAALLSDEFEAQALPDGEWWVLDEVEGAVNHIHGLADWCVSVALVRDGRPVLAVVYQPVGNLTYTALAGFGAQRNGRPLQVSRKSELNAAIVATSQSGDEEAPTRRRVGDAIVALLGQALFVRTTIPTTFPLLLVATGQLDAYWQYPPVELSGVAAGMLLAAESGAVVTDLDGRPWRPGAHSIVVSAPGVHAQTLHALTAVT